MNSPGDPHPARPPPPLLANDRNVSLAEDRVRDGLCPLCGTRLYKLERRTRLLGLKKAPPKNDGSQYRRVPLDIVGEVMRGQCLRCTGAGSAAIMSPDSASVYVPMAAGGRLAPPLNTPSTSIPPSGNTLGPVTPTPLLWTNGATPSKAVPVDARPGFGGDNLQDAVAVTFDTALGDAPIRAELVPVSTTATYHGDYNETGQRHGHGVLLWVNGDRYEGKFWNGMRDGDGTLNFADGTEYVGTWQLNRMDGQGTRRYANGNVYTGEYQSGRKHGQGRIYFANGDMYVGGWRDDQMNGAGKYHYNTGRAFEGNFENGKKEGRGKTQAVDGSMQIYCYTDGNPQGEGVQWSKDRKKIWRLLNGKKKEKISVEEGKAIAQRCGRAVTTAVT